jgi:outer membrane protein OmpA-like peptidoglycan-associated protein
LTLVIGNSYFPTLGWYLIQLGQGQFSGAKTDPPVDLFVAGFAGQLIFRALIACSFILCQTDVGHLTGQLKAKGTHMKTKFITIAMIGMLAAGCTPTADPITGSPQINRTLTGAGLGAAAGALAGLVYADAKNLNSGDQREAILIAAGIGALGGGGVGLYMDNQEAELRQQLQDTGVSVTRSGENIILNLPSNVTFDVDKDQVTPQFQPVLNSVALVMKKYNQTLLDVTGHTDSTGSDVYNLDLSNRRALSVANYLSQVGQIDGRRFAVAGFGEQRPIASNASTQGRTANRRVEIQITPLQQ